MTQLAGFLDVVLRGVGLVGLSIVVGGVAFRQFVLCPTRETSSLLARAAETRTLRLIAWSALALAATQLVVLGMKPWALAAPGGAWPLAEFLTTPFALAGLGRAAVSLTVTGVALRLVHRPRASVASAALVLTAVALVVSSAWLSHALGRLEDRTMLVALDALHRSGAAVWIGGLVHLLGFWLSSRSSRDDALALRILGRFSRLAVVAVSAAVGGGVALALYYVDSLDGLLGTGYGVMVLSKVALLAAALLLGASNFVLVRRARRRQGEPPPRVRWFVEAEIGLAVTLLFAAASLTSLPPARDVQDDRVPVGEVAARFLPRWPRLTSPAVSELLAAAAPITDSAAPRQPEEYAWSEYNHHMAGLFVLAMGLLAALQRTGRMPWARHWPLLLLGLAAFMLVRNDPRAWPLGPAGFWETLVLPDVLQHRISVLLVVGLGVFEWLVSTRRLRGAPWPYVFPVLCAVGGGLLLTHSHAMFNLKAEFLTEVAHTPLAILGVTLAWARWLELRLPPPEGRLPGGVWVVAMMLMGILLVFYREG